MAGSMFCSLGKIRDFLVAQGLPVDVVTTGHTGIVAHTTRNLTEQEVATASRCAFTGFSCFVVPGDIPVTSCIEFTTE